MFSRSDIDYAKKKNQGMGCHLLVRKEESRRIPLISADGVSEKMKLKRQHLHS
ncbi:MAG: hypothetical protein V4487_00510 [Chlamydiota bacterium]